MDTNPRADRAQITEKVPSFERFFEQEHLLTDRILDCATAIVKQLRALPDGATISRDLYAAMALLVYLNENFADQTHLAQEEAAIPLAVAREMPSRDVEWVYSDHDQGRAYAKAAGVAWGRINAGDETDLPHAINDFARYTEGLVKMFAYHAEREDHSLFPEMARYLSDDDDLIMHVVTQIGPPDVSPYITLVADMEQALGIRPPDSAPDG